MQFRVLKIMFELDPGTVFRPKKHTYLSLVRVTGVDKNGRNLYDVRVEAELGSDKATAGIVAQALAVFLFRYESLTKGPPRNGEEKSDPETIDGIEPDSSLDQGGE